MYKKGNEIMRLIGSDLYLAQIARKVNYCRIDDL